MIFYQLLPGILPWFTFHSDMSCLQSLVLRSRTFHPSGLYLSTYPALCLRKTLPGGLLAESCFSKVLQTTRQSYHYPVFIPALEGEIWNLPGFFFVYLFYPGNAVSR